MAAKGTAQANAAMTNQYVLEIAGAPDIFFVRVGELTSELVLAELADKTMQTTGQVNPGEFEADQYVHHDSEVLFLDALYILARTGAPLHKLGALLHLKRANGSTVRSILIDGLICKGKKSPELSAGDDGSAVMFTWTFSYDDILPA